MDEKRKSKRTSMPADLVIKRLDSGESREVAVEVTEVSKGGIGFTCKEPLQVGEMYEAFLQIWTKEVIHSIFQIVRVQPKEDAFFCGAVFIGLPDKESSRIEVYQTIEDIRKNQ